MTEADQALDGGEFTPEGTPSGVPSLVTVDDLKHEIGEWVAACLQKNKLIRRMAIQQQILMKKQVDQETKIKQAVELKESNDRLSEQNRLLGDELTTVRGELKSAQEEAVKQRQVIAALQETETKYKGHKKRS